MYFALVTVNVIKVRQSGMWPLIQNPLMKNIYDTFIGNCLHWYNKLFVLFLISVDKLAVKPAVANLFAYLIYIVSTVFSGTHSLYDRHYKTLYLSLH